ncbi:MAG: response regulator [Elusimicrobia bacterium]|nr:response regulator [Elusimicrobiota bacterium]
MSSSILIVDDNKIDGLLIKEILGAQKAGYNFFLACDGREALKILNTRSVDLVLLDIVMPGIDGFEILRKIKSDGKLKHIPVIIITSLGETGQKITGFEIGAADYIVKPINGDEARARVEAHIRIKKDRDNLEELNQKILRTQQALIEASKMASVGSLAAGVAHEFNNILFIMSGYLQVFSKSRPGKNMAEIAEVFRELIERGNAIVGGLSDFACKGKNYPKIRVNIARELRQSIMLLRRRFESAGVGVLSDIEEAAEIKSCKGQMAQVFVNIMLNAVEAMGKSRVKMLKISLKKCGHKGKICNIDAGKKCGKNQCAVVSFSDTGCGILAKARDKIFDPFFTTKGILGGGDSAVPGRGLGLFLSYGIIKRHGGFIHVKSKPGRGSVFALVIPII